jgi:hypothetical protein
MNEFTKEELELIYWDFKNTTRADIADKAKKMLDKYCEHLERVSSADDNGHMFVKCARCDMVFWHEKD